MAITITVDGTDVTSLVRLDSIAVEMKAYGGEVGSGSVIFDDTTGTANPATPMKEWVLTESGASPTTIAGGYIAERDIGRGPLTVSTQRQFLPVLEDYNAALADRILMGASARRPEETDYARVQWLLSTGVLSHLDGAGHVPNADKVTMEPANYRGKYAIDVLRECAEAANKNFYVYFKSGTGWVLFYDKANATTSAFTSSLQISDVFADIDNSTCFGASDIDYTRDPISIFSTMVVRWRSGWIRETNEDTRDEFRRKDIFRRRTRCRTASAARRWAAKQLEKTDEEVQRLTLTVNVPSSALGELQPGKRIQVKLASRGITSFTYFRIVAATFRPAFGTHATDVRWKVTLIMRDKERLLGGGVGGSGGSGISGGGGTGGGGTGGGDSSGGGNDGGEEPDDDPSPPGGGVDTGEFILDDWTRAAFGTRPAEVARVTTSTTGQTVDINIPDGSDVAQRLLLMFYVSTASDASGEVTAQLTALGWELLQSFTNAASTSGGILCRIIDGTEGFSGENDVVTISYSSGTENTLASVHLIAGGPATSAGISDVLAAGEATPPNSGWTGEDLLAYVIGFDNANIAGGPVSPYDEIEDFSDTGVGLKIHKGDVTGAFNPGDFTASGSGAQHSATVGIRFTDPEWGEIPRGEGVDTPAPWIGGNRYIKVMSGTATVATTGTTGTIAMTADNTEVSMVLKSDAADDPSDQPWGPWADGDCMLLYRWKVSALGTTTKVDPNTLEWRIITDGWRGTWRYNLGDAVTYSYQSGGQERGIVGYQASVAVDYTPYLEKTLVTDTYYWTRMDCRGRRFAMKHWAGALADEPITWDIDEPKVDDDTTTPADVSQLYLIANGNSGMTFTFDTAYAQVGPSASGPATGALPRGDGVTTTWTVLPWIGLLKAWVDGILTVPSTFDRDAGTFTFDRAPADGAWITVEYVPA